ncbi:MAG: carboxypeptidase regulatory-like domain-containing protein [Vicinamibacterales bacterium]
MMQVARRSPARPGGIVVLCWLALTLLAAPAAAQSVSGSISGTVVDSTQQVVPGAVVTLVNEQTLSTRGTVTTDTGDFVFSAVQPGRYTVKIEMPGFRPVERQNLMLPANERLSLGTIQLEVGGITETVTTTAEGTVVQTASSERSALLTDKQIEMVAVRGRDVMSLLRVLPGVAYGAEIEAPGGSFGTTTPNISGIRNTWNTVTVDGLVGNDLGSPQIFSGTINFDAIGEVKVQLNNYQAEHGRNGGAMVSIVTKSGTRDFKGSAYLYKRHESLNANDFFNNRNGIAKPLYRYTTVGATLGGPVPLEKLQDKLFFFYSFENWDTRTPQPVRQVTVPTALERAGDFSQSLNQAGQLFVVRDPVTGQPFPGNRIPASRINPNGAALLTVFPLPNALDRGVTAGNYNYQFQESLEVPRRQHLIRMDYRPTAADAIYGRFSNWYADNQGFAVPAGAANWGLLGQHYTFKDASFILNYTRILNPRLVNELSVGIRHSTEAGSALSEQGLNAVNRSNIGFTLGQFDPSINPLGMIPNATFTGVPNPAAITFEGRFPLTGADTFYTVNDTMSLARGNHVYKAGLYFEHARNEEGRTGIFNGSFQFNVETANPLDTRHPYANALLGNFRQYSESTARPGGDGTANVLEWFVQDAWKASRRLTLDYGARFGWYSHWRQKDGAAAAFSLQRYDPSRAPLLYQPVLVGTQRLSRNPVTGAIGPAVLIGALVPGTGDLTNGLVEDTGDDYPGGFKEAAPILIEPRVGLAYDLSGDGKTALRASVGIFHNTRVSGNVNWQASRNPPLQFNPEIFYGSMSTLLSSTGVNFPTVVQGFELETHTPRLYSYTAGVQHDIGWDTVVDVAYVGSKTRDLLQTRNINLVPYAARFAPANQDPTRPGNPLPDNFFRPYPGYGDINFFENTGIADYDALQLQINRRFTRGLQFGVAYTLSRSKDFTSAADTGTGANMRIPTYQDPREWSVIPAAGAPYGYGLSSFDQTHVFVINYTWDLPKASSLWDNAVMRAVFDNWQLSGITAFASGTPSGVILALQDSGTDLTGGGDGTRVIVTGEPTLSGGERDLTRWFNTAVFARPARNEDGNGGKDIIRLPGVSNWDVTLFKRIPFSSGRRWVQFRWEIYNLFNHTQFNDVDRTATFNPAGQQVNARFGQVISTRSPRIMQLSLRVVF